MRLITKMLSAAVVIIATSCSSNLFNSTRDYQEIIPQPRKVVPAKGVFHHKSGAEPFTLVADAGMHPEGYMMEICKDGITVHASTPAGAFYARQTLAQMAGIQADELDSKSWKTDCCVIDDYPEYEYRGTMVDVSRHFRSLGFLYRHIDAMAAVKLNRLHMHLTDAAGWRLQIDSYPLLTEQVAYRTGKSYREWWMKDGAPRTYCTADTPGAYGGFYTKDEIRELVAYAAERMITIIPEIEIPGHNDEVCTAYPEISCTGIPHTCGDVCPGKDMTFDFFEKVLDEVMEVFPSEYIHIGGDEAGKLHWAECPDCQRRMKQEGLASLDELQSYTIRRISEYVESHGRHIIGWDEILQGGLDPHATVMSWRGVEGGIEAISSGHAAIMTPGAYCYIDSTQDAPNDEPAAFGNYLSLEKVYSYDPAEGIGKDLPGKLLGLQANLWAEMVETDEAAERMYWPRALAIAETGWYGGKGKDYQEFRRRALIHIGRMLDAGYNVFDLSKEKGQRQEYLNGVEHLAKGCPVVYNGRCRIDSRYPAAGEATLTDGLGGSWSYGDGRWQGFLCDLDVTIDLGKETKVSDVVVTSQHNIIPGVFYPEKVEVLVSSDGEQFISVGSEPSPEDRSSYGARFHDFKIAVGTTARYIRVAAPRGPERGYMFFDEIVVR